MPGFFPSISNRNPASEQMAYLVARARYNLAVRHCHQALSWLGPSPDPAVLFTRLVTPPV